MFQKSTLYAGIKIVNSLPPSVTILNNDKAKFKVGLRKYLHTHSFYSVDKFFMCKIQVFHTVNLYMCIYDFFHILLSLWHNKDPWNVCESDYIQILSNVCN